MYQDRLKLEKITESIIDDIERFDEEFEKALKSDVQLINSISKYMIKNTGKKIRPILTIFSAKLCGEPTVNSYRAAAMVELLHVATLIHDDVVDDATMRRGKPSTHKKFGESTAILAGNSLLTVAFEILTQNVLQIFAFRSSAKSKLLDLKV